MTASIASIEKRKAYHKTDKYKQYQREYQRAYQKLDKYKSYQKAYYLRTYIKKRKEVKENDIKND